ncbi:MAG: hypothetical protein HY903_21830 [Deltaproteobacteria bacterium]|nr:hypothetical protein [Deltaproteobacteria bacterium]
MTPPPKDALLESAREAEEVLRKVLEAKRGGAELAARAAPPVPAEQPASDPADGDDGTWLALTESDGSVDWALRLVPPSELPEHLPADEPTLQGSLLDGVARAVPLVAQALRQGRVFELIGPGPVLEGLRNGSLELIPSKIGGVLGGVRATGRAAIVHQARFRPVGLGSSIGPGLGMAAASAVLGHMHMVEIRRQLARLEGRLDRVLEGQQATRHGKLFGALEILQDVARTMSCAGGLSALQVQRLAGAELDLRQVASELEQLHRRYAGRTEGLAGTKVPAFADAFGVTRVIELDDGSLLVAARGAHVLLERLLGAYATVHEPASLPARATALEAARDRLADVERRLDHLRQFHAHCRAALDREQARMLRLSTREVGRVSEALRQDRLAVAELLATARRLALGMRPESAAHVVRVDARQPTVRAQVALLDASA